MPHKSKSPAARQSGRGGKQFQSNVDANFITAPPSVRNTYAARVVARRFGFPAAVAALVADLAGLAVRS